MFSNLSLYQIGVRVFWIGSFLLIFLIPKFELHQILNTYHNSFFDTLAKYSTNIGDGLFFILIILIFLFISLKTSLLLAVSFVVSGAIAQFLKIGVFPNVMRPMHFFQNDPNFHVIDNFSYHFTHSFPSGHATSCFALFTLLAFTYSKNYKLQLLLLFAAILFSFTRVYLSQHFYQDILAGSIIGTFVSQYTYQLLNSHVEKWDFPLRRKKS